MKKYLAVRYYGHYVCAYTIEAENEKIAYNKAIYGEKIFETIIDNFYGEGGFVKELTTNVSFERQMQWLIEAIELGYPANAQQHMFVFGLPFVIPDIENTSTY